MGRYGDLRLEVDTGYRYTYDHDLVEELDDDESLTEDFVLTVTNSDNKLLLKN